MISILPNRITNKMTKKKNFFFCFPSRTFFFFFFLELFFFSRTFFSLTSPLDKETKMEKELLGKGSKLPKEGSDFSKKVYYRCPKNSNGEKQRTWSFRPKVIFPFFQLFVVLFCFVFFLSHVTFLFFFSKQNKKFFFLFLFLFSFFFLSDLHPFLVDLLKNQGHPIPQIVPALIHT